MAMDFVTAAANVRAHIFHIPLKPRFEIKCMEANTITSPTITTPTLTTSSTTTTTAGSTNTITQSA